MNLFHHGGKGSITSDYKFIDTDFTEAEDKFEGYYILVKDIDMNGSKFASEVSYNRGMYIDKGNLVNVGLTGTFDGNGYRLYNFSPVYAGGGLFSAVNGGTVKNVSITKDKVSSINDLPYFAGILNGATIENVYININYDLSSGTGSPVIVKVAQDTTFKNCIFVDGTTNTEYKGLLRYAHGTTNLTDCYYISNAKITQKWADGGWKSVDGYNQTADYTMNGIKRYATADDMIADVANNNYDAFVQSGCWDITSGMPVWKN